MSNGVAVLTATTRAITLGTKTQGFRADSAVSGVVKVKLLLGSQVERCRVVPQFLVVRPKFHHPLNKFWDGIRTPVRLILPNVRGTAAARNINKSIAARDMLCLLNGLRQSGTRAVVALFGEQGLKVSHNKVRLRQGPVKVFKLQHRKLRHKSSL